MAKNKDKKEIKVVELQNEEVNFDQKQKQHSSKDIEVEKKRKHGKKKTGDVKTCTYNPKNWPKDKSIYDSANCLSKMFFHWLKPIIHQSRVQETYEVKDLYPCSKRDRSDKIFKDIHRYRVEGVKKGKSLLKTVFSSLPKSYWLSLIPCAISAAGCYAYPQLIKVFLEHIAMLVAGAPVNVAWGWGMVILFVAIMLFVSLGEQILYVLTTPVSVRMKVALTSLVYNKILRIRESAKQQLSSGNMVNLMFTDATRLQSSLQIFTYFLLVPLQLITGIVLVVLEIGIVSLVAFGFLLLLLILIGGLGFKMMRIRIKMLRTTDERVRRVSELLSGVRVIKLFGNEDIFYQRVGSSRAYEISNIKKFSILQLLLITIITCIIPIMLLVTFAVMEATGKTLTSSLVYTVMSLFNVLRMPFMMLPMIVITFQDMIVSVRRMEALLSLPEKDEKSFEITDAKGKPVPDWTAKVLKEEYDGDLEGDVSPPSSDTDNSDDLLDTAVDIPYPLTFTWANARDRDLPIILDPNFKMKLKEMGQKIKAIKKDIKKNLRKNGKKEKNAWAEYVELVPAHKIIKKDNPIKFEEYFSFNEWLKKGCPKDKSQTPVPDVPKALRPVLHDISMEIKRGEVIGVFGKVGCGKTSLLNAILGELRVATKLDEFEELKDEDGNVVGTNASDVEIKPLPDDETKLITIRGRVAYCAQSAWIMNATVRDNIVFGMPYNEDWYNEVCARCCLLPDFDQFVAGDQTEIGEKGVTLSGGQKHRIALARAVYSKSDIYFLDDPLSAVDAHVGKRLMEDVILGLLGGKTVILVTHQVQYLPKCTRSLFIDEGRIAASGSYEELKKSDVDFHGLINKKGDVNDLEVEEAKSRTAVAPTGLMTIAASREGSNGKKKEKTTGKVKKHDAETGKITKTESTEQGSLKFSVVKKYFQASGSGAYIICIFVLFLMDDALLAYADYTLSQWAAGQGSSSNTMMAIYGGCTAGYIVLNFIASILLILVCVSTSRHLHMDLVRSVLRAPMSFFDTTPTGRILNRFSKDTDSADMLVPMYTAMLVSIVAVILEMIVIIGVTNEWTLIAVAVVFVLFVLIFIRFRATARELRRLDNVTRSPVLSIATESLSGVSTIRSYNMELHFTHRYYNLIDVNTAASLPFLCSPKWLSVRMDLCGLILIFVMGAICIGTATTSPRVASLAGAGLTYCFTIPSLVRQVASSYITWEAEMSSVERIIEYRDNLPEETKLEDTVKATIRKDHKSIKPEDQVVEPEASWPRKGSVEFKNVCMRYRPELPLVLKDVSFKIKSGEKVGVVGRTGAGKTSVTSNLFQLYNCDEGSTILYDGVDITKVPLHRLRTSLAIIPQDAFLFSGTLRSNLDMVSCLIDEGVARKTAGKNIDEEGIAKIREEEKKNVLKKLEKKPIDDSEIWDALDKCLLKGSFEARQGGLGFKLSDNGSNLSAGERQLVCLAKALLVNAKVIVMDEATAQVDQKSDTLVQKIIRDKFKDKTIICIAHRLQTIIDFDRILVLDHGTVAEFDTPNNLLNTPGSIFGSLVDETGPENSAFLRSVAAGERTVFDKIDEEDETSETNERSQETDSSSSSSSSSSTSASSSSTSSSSSGVDSSSDSDGESDEHSE